MSKQELKPVIFAIGTLVAVKIDDEQYKDRIILEVDLAPNDILYDIGDENEAVWAAHSVVTFKAAPTLESLNSVRTIMHLKDDIRFGSGDQEDDYDESEERADDAYYCNRD